MVAVSILRASSAHAQGWRFLEKLSGPGNFIGYEVEVKLLCRYDQDITVTFDPAAEAATADEKKAATATALAALGFSLPCVFKASNDKAARGSAATITKEVLVVNRRTNETFKATVTRNLDYRRRAWAVAAAANYLSGTTNTLPYDRDVDRIVRIAVLEESFDFRLKNRWDLGVAVGQNWFFPPDRHFFRASLEPRVTWKFFDLTRHRGDDNPYWGTASLRVGAVIFSDKFNATDFGAVGPYQSHGQVVVSIRFILDFDRNPFKRN